MRRLGGRQRIKAVSLLVVVGSLTAMATAVPAQAQRDESPSPVWGATTDAVIPDAADLRIAAKAAPSLNHAPRNAKRTDATALRADSNVVDIAFVYPAALTTQADIGGIAGLRAKFNAAIAEANRTYANSNIGVQLRYVGDRQLAAPTSQDTVVMLDNLANLTDGVYDEAAQLREETHADLISLWASGSVPNGASCGRGFIGGMTTRDSEVSAWSMVFYTECADKYLVFPHEVGHNLSADHDVSAASPALSSKPYARGYTDPANRFVTVMSYYDHCLKLNIPDCVRRPYYSSPTARTPEGWPLGNAGTDNTRAIAEQAPLVANYRQSQIYGAAPTITGTPRLGKTLSANTEGWAPGNLTFTYQWFANGAPITGATGASLKLTKAHLRTTITVSVTGSAPYYQPVALGSAATAPVSKKTFRKTRRPAIKGKARPGRVLRATMKRWKPAKKVRYKYKWYRSNKAKPVGTGKRHRLTRKDRGKKIWVKAIAYKKNYETTSRQSKKIRVRR